MCSAVILSHSALAPGLEFFVAFGRIGIRRRVIEVMPDQRQPVFASGDAVGAVLESFGIDAQFVGVFAAADVDLNRSSVGRLMHNGQACFGDLVQITLQFKCGQVHHAWWLFGDDDFGARLAFFD